MTSEDFQQRSDYMSGKHAGWAQSLARDCGIKTPTKLRGPKSIPLPEKGQIAGEYAGNLKIEEIARRHNTSTWSVLTISDEMGIARRRPDISKARSNYFKRLKRNKASQERRAAAKAAASAQVIKSKAAMPDPGAIVEMPVKSLPQRIGFWRSLGMMLGMVR